MTETLGMLAHHYRSQFPLIGIDEPLARGSVPTTIDQRERSSK